MSQTVRVIVVNTDESVAADLRSVLLSIAGVKIVAEVDEPALLGNALEQFPAELLLVHLDPSPTPMMDVVAPIIAASKERIAAVAMTEDRNAELVMRAMRAGMREFLWKPFPPEQLAEIIHRVGTESEGAGRQVGRLMCVIGTAGGVGATQVVANVGVELAQLEDANRPGVRPKVACVDLDLRFGQLAMQLDASPTWSIAELCETAEHIDAQMLERAMFKHPSGIHILTRPNEFAQAEQISAAQAASALAGLQEHYDYVLVDLPARFDATARAVYDMSDKLLLVLQLTVPSVRNADRILQAMASTGYAADRLQLVCNRVSRETGHLEQSDVEATLKRRMDYFIPEDWKTSSAAVNMGAPLMTQAPKSRLRMAYRQIAEALLGPPSGAAEHAAAENGELKKGLFGFLAGAKA